MSRIVGVLILLLLLVVGAAYALSPLYAFQQLKQAALTGDRDRLEALVDFPTVREDLRDQTESKAIKVAKQAGGIGHPLAMLFGRAATEYSDRALDKLVTPDAITELIRTGRGLHRRGEDAAPPGPGQPTAKAEKGPYVRYGYLTPDRFRVTIAPNRKSVAAAALIMDRRGLFSWRVEKVELRAVADEDVVKDLY
jgi:hypothetical protein